MHPLTGSLSPDSTLTETDPFPPETTTTKTKTTECGHSWKAIVGHHPSEGLIHTCIAEDGHRGRHDCRCGQRR